MRRGEKNQSDKIDLEIHKDIPVPIIIDYSLLFKQYFYCAFLKSKYTSTDKMHGDGCSDRQTRLHLSKLVFQYN